MLSGNEGSEGGGKFWVLIAHLLASHRARHFFVPCTFYWQTIGIGINNNSYNNTMNDSNATEPSTTPISQGSDADGPFSYGPVATPVTTATQSYEESSSGNTMVYFFLCWIVLLILIVALVYVLVECRCRRNQKQRQLQSLPETHDVEVAEPVVAVESSRSRKMNYHIGLAILFVGSLFGLGLSIFSIVTCEFAAINESVRLDVNQLSISIYNLGLWKVDVTSNSALSGCVSTGNLPFLDAPYAFAKASAIIAVMFGGPLILMCLLTKPGFVGIKVRYLLVCLYVLASLFQLTTLTLFGSMYCNSSLFEESENNCRSGIGSVASVSAALFWMLEVVAAACLPFSNT